MQSEMSAIRSLSERVQELLKPASVYKSRVSVREGARIHIVACEEIVFIESSGDYITIHTEHKKLLHSEQLSSLEVSLDPLLFTRIHRSFIVNIGFVKELISHYNGDYTVALKTGHSLKLSRNYRDKVMQLLG